MFDKNDCIECFNNILKIEEDMREEGKRLFRIIKDDKARQLLKKLIDDEKRHMIMVQELIDIVEKK